MHNEKRKKMQIYVGSNSKPKNVFLEQNNIIQQLIL